MAEYCTSVLLRGTAGRLLSVAASIVTATLCIAASQQSPEPRSLAPLPALESQANPKQVEMGRLLFFDTRLSGDDTISCAVCHDPDRGWTDGGPMSIGYPGSLYFRNTPTVVNVVYGRYMYWDGRLPASDLATLVRDHISEAHFLQADGRLVIERLRQVPAYEDGFKEAFGGEPTYGRILDAVAAFVTTLRSQNIPFDRYLDGDESAFSDSTKRGLELFRGKAGCIQCHDGSMLSDEGFHNVGLPPNPDIFRMPQRHITFRRFFRTLGLGKAAELREDPGLYAITKEAQDWGKFRTPTLREVSNTPPYMHDGSIGTLEEVVSFYDAGGGPGAGKDPRLRPLGLTDQEKGDLVEFLKSLAGDPVTVPRPQHPEYVLRALGEN